jgi:hypothetical protein
MKMKIYIRPSFIVAADECPYKAKLQYVDQIKTTAISSNLVYGTAVHDPIAKYLTAHTSGLNFDMEAQFLMNWDNAVKTQTIRYNSTTKADDLREMGKLHCQRFPAAWTQTGLVPVVDEKGFLIERTLQYEILPGVILTGTLDLVAMDADGRFIIIDFKTPASESPELFVEMSDQLTAYQILVENNPSLGIPAIDQLGYMELIKKKVPKTNRGTGPVVNQPLLSNGPRSKEQIEAFVQKVAWIVDDMKRGRHPKRPRMAYNTPCSLCEYQNYCHNGETEDLIFPAAMAKAA